jgi:aryl-alcohol dehydrogenase-like predicted oxidoreductase
MNYRTIAQTDIALSEISLGCWTLGGPNFSNGAANGWAGVDEQEAVRAVHEALASGVNHFDNADVYGNGVAERLLGRALKGRCESVVVSSKVGHFRGTAEHCYDYQNIINQCHTSLRNLGRERIDIYYFHHGDFGPGDRWLEQGLAAMDHLKAAGKIGLVGLSAYSEEDFMRLVPKIRPSLLQSWAHILDDRFISSGGRVAGLMEEYNLQMVAFSPLAQGRLLGKYRADAPPVFESGDMRGGNPAFSAQGLRAIEPLIAKLRQRFGEQSEQLVGVALGFLLAHPRVLCPIVGFRNVAQVRSALAAAGQRLSEEEMAYIRGAVQPLR